MLGSNDKANTGVLDVKENSLLQNIVEEQKRLAWLIVQVNFTSFLFRVELQLESESEVKVELSMCIIAVPNSTFYK